MREKLEEQCAYTRTHSQRESTTWRKVNVIGASIGTNSIQGPLSAPSLHMVVGQNIIFFPPFCYPFLLLFLATLHIFVSFPTTSAKRRDII